MKNKLITSLEIMRDNFDDNSVYPDVAVQFLDGLKCLNLSNELGEFKTNVSYVENVEECVKRIKESSYIDGLFYCINYVALQNPLVTETIKENFFEQSA